MENTNLIYNSTSDPIELVKQVNKIRLACNKGWYQITFENETSGEMVRIKCYNTWVQIAEKPIFNTDMDMKVIEFKANILIAVKKLIIAV